MALSSFREAFDDGVRNAWCTVMRGANNYWRYMRDLATFWDNDSSGAVPFLGPCNPPVPVPVPFPPPDGQCVSGYQVSFIGSWFNAQTQAVVTEPTRIPFTCTGPLFGPISAPDHIVTPQNPTQEQTVVFVTARLSASGPIAQRNLFARTWPKGSYWVSYSRPLVRCGGLPDNCGTGIGTPPYQFEWNHYDYTFNYNDNGNTITIPVGLVWLQPTLNIDGTVNARFRADITVPVNVPISVSGTLNLGNGDVNLTVGGDGDIIINVGGGDYTNYRPPTPPPPPSTTNPPPELPDPTTDPETPEGQTIRGVIVSLVDFDDSNTTLIGQDDIPTIIAPYAGLVSFQIRINGVTSWTEDIPVKVSRQFIPCPWDGGAVDVKFSPRSPGTEAALLPVYALAEQSVRALRSQNTV